MQELPIACSLDAAGYQARQDEWQELMSTSLRAQSRTPSGMRLTFTPSPEVVARIDALAAAERDCCAFATWTVRHAPEESILTVDSHGEGVAAVWEIFAAGEARWGVSGLGFRHS